VDVRAPPGIARATESCFALRRPAPSQAVLVLTRMIPGPQEIELDLSMEIYHDATFVGSAIAKIFIFVSQYEFWENLSIAGKIEISRDGNQNRKIK